MDDKLRQANEHIEELIDGYISVKSQNYDDCCLRVVLLNKDRKNCGNIDCNVCNQKAKEEYRTKLLNHYIVS